MTVKQVDGQSAGFLTDADLSAKQYHAVKLSSGKLTATHTKGGRILGILQDQPDGSSSEQVGQVRLFGLSRGKLGGTVSENGILITDTDGALIADDAADQSPVGMALEEGVDGDVIGIVLFPQTTTTS